MNVDEIVKVLRDPRTAVLIAEKRIELREPATAETHNKVLRELGPEIHTLLCPLLSFTSGITINSGDTSLYPEFSLDFNKCGTGLWVNVFPVAVEIGTKEELLYWDLTDPADPRVYFTTHNAPAHCMCFLSMADCIRHFLEPDGFERLYRVPVKEMAIKLSNFEMDTAELGDFVRAFPGHYLVHDLRKSDLFTCFSYSSDCAIRRFKGERLWVQEQHRGFFVI